MTKRKDGSLSPLGVDKSAKIWEFLNRQGFVDSGGKVRDTLCEALKAGNVNLPEEFENQKDAVEGILKKLAGKLDIKNADERNTIHLNKERFLGADFKSLWDRVKHQTTYRVNFNNEKLISDAATAIEKNPPITKTCSQFRKTGIDIGKGGVTAEETFAS